MSRVLGSIITAAGCGHGFALGLALTIASVASVSCGAGGGEARDPVGQAAGAGAGGRGGAPSRGGQLAALIEPGGVCTTAGDCKSGFCSDGVCCRSDCTGICQSCAMEGSVGTCANIPVGSDPRGDCPDEGATSCGRNGSCDGTGSCAVYAAGTICSAQSCSGSTVSHAARCDGAGACAAAVDDSCGPYMCKSAGDACRADCTSAADCVGGAACVNGSCGPKPPGAACAAASDCASGFCVEGVCCTTACGGSCRSCAITGSEGRCIAVPAGIDPLNHCADQGAASCGTDGACDGAGACQRYASGTVCAAASCSGAMSMPARTCNGGGTCLMVVPSSCGAYTCASADACRTSCAADGDCVAGNVCTMGSCAPPAPPDGGTGGRGDGGGGGGAGGSGGGGASGGTGGGGAGARGGSGGAGTAGAAGTGSGAAGGGAGGTAGTGGRACAGYAFCDDFEDGDASGWTPSGGTWSVIADGSSVYRAANGPGASLAGSAAWTDQTVEARVKVTQFGNDKAGFRGGVIARYASANSFYVFLYDGSGALRLLQNDDMPTGRSGTCGKIDAGLTAGSWHTMRVTVSGASSVRIQTFLDGAPVHDCTSTSGTVVAGAAGAYVHGANTIVEFDDVKVSTP